MTEEAKNQILDISKDLFKRFGFTYSNCDLEILNGQEEKEIIFVKIESEEDCSLLLGRHGENLRAFEQVARLMIAKKISQKLNILVDINNYRKDRNDLVVELAKTTAQKVIATQKAEVLFPMSAYERRIVHLALASLSDIITESIGDEPKRRVVIKPASV